MTRLPDFATNRVVPPMTVAEELNRLFRVNREAMAIPPHIAIATAYVNPAGFLLIADELGRAPRVRLLLGAEPIPEPAVPHSQDSKTDEVLRDALTSHEAWLKAERDALGFTPGATEQAWRLVEWLRAADERGEPVVEIRRYTGGFLHGKAFISLHDTHPAFLAGSSNLTHAGLMLNAELNIGSSGTHGSAPQVIEWFEECWRHSEPYDLAALYEPLWAEHTPWSIFLRMLLERYGAHLADDEQGDTTFKLTRFQADGVKRMRRLLDEIGGVLVADEVGLGKTFLALEVIAAATEKMRQRVVIAAPAALKASVWEPLLKKHGYSRHVAAYSYEEIRNNLNPDNPKYQDFLYEAEDAALVVIDEAHNLRNAAAARSAAIDRLILAGRYPKKVVLLTATPVNNSLRDLETLLRYFIRNDAMFAAQGIPSIRGYIRHAERTDPEALTPAHLFDLMDQVAVRRTRSFVKQNYHGETIEIGGRSVPIEFPEPVVRRIDYDLDEAGEALVREMTYALDIPEEEEHAASYTVRRTQPGRLLLARYTPSAYLKSENLDATQVTNSGLLRSALLKRLESSPVALGGTLGVLIKAHEAFLAALDQGHVLTGEALREYVNSESEDLDEILSEFDGSLSGVSSAEDYHADLLRSDVERDLGLIRHLRSLADNAAHTAEPKVAELASELAQIAESARRVSPKGISTQDRRKVIVFSTYADTIRDLHRKLSDVIAAAPDGSPLADYRDRIAPPIIGEYASGKSGGIHQAARAGAIANFAPRTAGVLDSEGNPRSEDKYDILLTTDVLAEGVNLQQAAQIINYDLPWNPMRIVQRHGRVDRIGSQHPQIHLGVFFPAQHLDEYLKLEQTLVRKLRQADAAVGTGTVLPGVSNFPPRSHYDADDLADEIEQIVKQDGGSAAGSGEEYRRRLLNAFKTDGGLRKRLEDLPLGVGSGFVNAEAERNVFVFCMRMGESERVWFRNVYATPDWRVARNDEGSAEVEDETLHSLNLADPGGPERERVLPHEAFVAAYEAWEEARRDAYAEWVRGMDPNNLKADLPASFRDAAEFVREVAARRDPDEVRDVIARLGTVPSTKAALAMRRALRDATDDAQRFEAIRKVLDEYGIQPAEKVTPLPAIELDDVRLVCWMAVSAGARQDAHA